MPSAEVEAIKKELVEINEFVRGRVAPVEKEVGLLREEADRIGREVSLLQEKEREVRRRALAGYAEDSGLAVSDGPYAGLGVLDLGLLRRFARSQRRESFGPGFIERVESAQRSLAESVTAAEIQESYEEASRRLGRWFTVDRRPTGQYESFGRAVLQSMTRAAMDSTTAGSGDELVATLEARELWLDVNLRTLVAPLGADVLDAVEPVRHTEAAWGREFLPGHGERGGLVDGAVDGQGDADGA